MEQTDAAQSSCALQPTAASEMPRTKSSIECSQIGKQAVKEIQLGGWSETLPATSAQCRPKTTPPNNREARNLSRIVQYMEQDMTCMTLTEEKVKLVLRQIASALNCLHKKKIAHCNVRPDNISVNNTDKAYYNVLLTCLGSVVKCDHFMMVDSHNVRDIGFLPPEGFTEPRVNGAALDMWALGITLYMLLYGVHPFRVDVSMLESSPKPLYAQLQELICNTEPVYPDSPNVSKMAKSLIKALLSKDPMNRLTAEDVLNHQFLFNFALIHDMFGEISFEENGDPNLFGYELQKKKFGKGGSAIVKLAKAIFDGVPFRFIAVKKFYDVKRGTRLGKLNENTPWEEFAIMMALDHPNIAKALRFMSDGKHCCIVMEYVEKAIVKFVSKYSLTCTITPEKVVMRYLQQICNALSYMRDKGIFHRDISFGNIRLTANGRVKVIDFGSAVVHDQCTATTTTPTFSAPELYKVIDRSVGPQDMEALEMWALGILLYMMLAGKHPLFDAFKGLTLAQVLKKQAETNSIEVKFAVRSNVSQRVQSLVIGLLITDPKKRTTLDQVREFLRSYYLPSHSAAVLPPDSNASMIINGACTCHDSAHAESAVLSPESHTSTSVDNASKRNHNACTTQSAAILPLDSNASTSVDNASNCNHNACTTQSAAVLPPDSNASTSVDNASNCNHNACTTQSAAVLPLDSNASTSVDNASNCNHNACTTQSAAVLPPDSNTSTSVDNASNCNHNACTTQSAAVLPPDSNASTSVDNASNCNHNACTTQSAAVLPPDSNASTSVDNASNCNHNACTTQSAVVLPPDSNALTLVDNASDCNHNACTTQSAAILPLDSNTSTSVDNASNCNHNACTTQSAAVLPPDSNASTSVDNASNCNHNACTTQSAAVLPPDSNASTSVDNASNCNHNACTTQSAAVLPLDSNTSTSVDNASNCNHNACTTQSAAVLPPDSNTSTSVDNASNCNHNACTTQSAAVLPPDSNASTSVDNASNCNHNACTTQSAAVLPPDSNASTSVDNASNCNHNACTTQSAAVLPLDSNASTSVDNASNCNHNACTTQSAAVLPPDSNASTSVDNASNCNHNACTTQSAAVLPPDSNASTSVDNASNCNHNACMSVELPSIKLPPSLHASNSHSVTTTTPAGPKADGLLQVVVRRSVVNNRVYVGGQSLKEPRDNHSGSMKLPSIKQPPSVHASNSHSVTNNNASGTQS